MGYKDKKDGLTIGLLTAPEGGRWDDFTCLNSLRDVEPSVGLVLDDRSVGQEPERPVKRSLDLPVAIHSFAG
jgi:hypothetical protein